MRILFVEDSRLLAQSTTNSLIAAGFTVDGFDNVNDAWAAWNMVAYYEAVILDLMLGEENGLDLLARARRAGLATPVLVLTALGEIDDRVRGLDQGADDYLVKPFAVDELVARLRALGRRPEALLDRVIKLGPVSYDVGARLLSSTDGHAQLSRAESIVVERLFRRADRIVSKEQLGEALHSMEGDYSENSLRILVHRVRRKLANIGGGVTVQVLRGLGYIATVDRRSPQ